MKKAKLITTTKGYRVVKEIEGSGNYYYAHPKEGVQDIMVRPATKDDFSKAYKFLGIDIEKVNPKLMEIINSELSGFPETKIASGMGEFENKWHYKFYYELIK